MDDLYDLKWCLKGEDLTESNDDKIKNETVEFIPYDVEYLKKLISDNLSD